MKTIPKLTKEDEERFCRYIELSDDCWNWIGWSSHGYGGFWMGKNNGNFRAHRISYEMFVMPLVKAVKELSAKIEAQQQEINALKGAK